MADQDHQQEPSVPSQETSSSSSCYSPLQHQELPAPSDTPQQELPIPSTPTYRSTPSRATEIESTSSDDLARKIFVGGLPHHITREEIMDYFRLYGTVSDTVIVSDQSTGRARGFGFVTFDSEEFVNHALRNRYHYLRGKQVEVKRAMPRNRGSNGTSINNYNWQGFSNSGHHPMYDPIYQNWYPQSQNWVMDCTGYGVCQNCGHCGYVYSTFHGDPLFGWAGHQYAGWICGKWMSGNGYHPNYAPYVQTYGPPPRPSGHFASANGNGSPTIMANGYGYGHVLRNGTTKMASVPSSVDPPEIVVAGDGEPEANNGSVPASTEPIVAVDGATGEQQPPKMEEEAVGHCDRETSRVDEAEGAPAEEDNGCTI